jgi:2-polyprenyl-3-methyl-5-hydroxy-6-metoxy-1,4-benzoquinol methylase
MSNQKEVSRSHFDFVDHEFQIEGIEFLGCCPICGSIDRETLHTDLIDKVFFTAAGRWTLHHCLGCRSAYLDPRPRPEFIHLAYLTYYTHEAPGPLMPFASLPLSRRIRLKLANGYCNWRYGTSNSPSSCLGVLVAFLLPELRGRLDFRFRYLPRPTAGARILDVGFGSGQFLQDAQSAGWQVSGVDPDAKVVESARKRGLDVRQGGIEAFSEKTDYFDAITISQVIEHVHFPVTVLNAAFGLLKPGGILYIDTPNIESFGHQEFGRDWRGVEPPRHLVIFRRESLITVLKNLGFNSIQIINRTEATQGMYDMSYRLVNNVDPYSQTCRSPWYITQLGKLKSYINPSRLEFITVMAMKRTS